MDCFRHPDEEATAFCRTCRQPLCSECYEQSYGGITHVCSETCAQKVDPDSDPDDVPDSTFDRMFGLVFLPLVMAFIGGVAAVLVITTTINNEATDEDLRAHGAGGRFNSTRYLLAKSFQAVGLTSWKADFLFGALVGVVFALVYIFRHRSVGGKGTGR